VELLGRLAWSWAPGNQAKEMIELRKSVIREEKGFTLMEVVVAVFILAVVLTPIIAYFGRNLNKLGELRSASIALNLAKEGVEKVRNSAFILGSFYVYKAGEGSFVDGPTAPAAQNLKLRVIRMGSSPLTVSVNSGAATGSIPGNTSPGTIIPCSGAQVDNVIPPPVTTITGGSFKDRFDIIYEYPDSIQTVNEVSWRTTYQFSNPSTPMEVTVRVFKVSAIDPSAQLVTAVESLR